MRKDISEATSPITPAEWLGDPTKINPLSQQHYGPDRVSALFAVSEIPEPRPPLLLRIRMVSPDFKYG